MSRHLPLFIDRFGDVSSRGTYVHTYIRYVPMVLQGRHEHATPRLERFERVEDTREVLDTSRYRRCTNISAVLPASVSLRLFETSQVVLSNAVARQTWRIESLSSSNREKHSPKLR